MTDSLLRIISTKLNDIFQYQDPRMPGYLRQSGKEFRKLDSPVYRVCLEAVAIESDIKNYLEIGVKEGGSLPPILANNRLERIHLCDLWSINGKKQCERKKVENILQEYISSASNDVDVCFLDGSSLETLKEETHSFDLIGVDGSHRRDVGAGWLRRQSEAKVRSASPTRK